MNPVTAGDLEFLIIVSWSAMFLFMIGVEWHGRRDPDQRPGKAHRDEIDRLEREFTRKDKP